jgi:Predicted nucleic-acid-binding protein containing a Zn-ribbon
MTAASTSGVDHANSYVFTQPFWDGISQGKLVLQYCPVTGRFQHPPRPVSIYTGRRHLEWREVTGLGAIYARTVIGKGDRRTRLVSVDLDEGVRVVGKLLGAEAAGEIGERVRLAWDAQPGGQKYPAFELCR